MRRNLLIFLSATAAILVGIELILGYAAFQKRADFRGFAIEEFARRTARGIDLWRANAATADRRSLKDRFNFAEDVFLRPINTEAEAFRAEIAATYEREFRALLAEAGEARVIGLYLPMGRGGERFQQFFLDLFERTGVEAIDMTADFDRFRSDEIFLEPYNGHLTRFANRQIAARVVERLAEATPGRSDGFDCAGARTPFRPDVSNTWTILDIAPYQVRTDALGFRSTSDAPYDPAKPFALFLGDSFTFGPYLPNEDAYPSMVARLIDGRWNVINGGVSGLTIRDERRLHAEMSGCLDAEVVVIQVLANDLQELTALKFNEYNLFGEVIDMPEAEKRFYESLSVSH